MEDSRGKQQQPDRYFSKASRKLLYCSKDVEVLPQAAGGGRSRGGGGFQQQRQPGGEPASLGAYSSIIAGSNHGIAGEKTPYDPLGVYDAGTHKWLQGKGVEEKLEPMKASTRSDRFLERTAEFNARLNAEPHNVQLWNAFLRFQEELSENQIVEEAKINDKHHRSKALWEIKAAFWKKRFPRIPQTLH
jgi:hypothetical protein